MTIVSQNNKKSNPPCQNPGEESASWIRFLRQLHIHRLLASLPDTRQQGKIQYSLISLLLWAFSACAFRTGSKHAPHAAAYHLSFHQQEGLLHLIFIFKAL